jgi:hypothetical protein
MASSELITDEFRKYMVEWVELKRQLSEARKDMKVLNTREKKLKEYIASCMQNTKIDTVKLSRGEKVTMKTTNRAGTMSKDAVIRGLDIYFEGDEVRAEAAMNCILDNIVRKDVRTVSITGLNKKASA